MRALSVATNRATVAYTKSYSGNSSYLIIIVCYRSVIHRTTVDPYDCLPYLYPLPYSKGGGARTPAESPDEKLTSQAIRPKNFVFWKNFVAGETQGAAEGRISQRSTTTRAVAARRSSAEVMQKLVLIDEFDREYKRLQRPATAIAKTDHSLRLSNTLRYRSLTDDRKAREYVAELHRYLNVADRIPPEKQSAKSAKINWINEPEPSTPRQAPRRQLESPGSSRQPARRKKKGKSRLHPVSLQ